MKIKLYTGVLMALASGVATGGQNSRPTEQALRSKPAVLTENKMSASKIRIIVDGKAIPASLIDSPTARDFQAMLPLTLMLKDYAATEKIAYLQKKLSREGAPPGYAPATGDIAYYAPWGNLAIFYKSFEYSDGLIRLGVIDADLNALVTSGAGIVRIERAAD